MLGFRVSLTVAIAIGNSQTTGLSRWQYVAVADLCYSGHESRARYLSVMQQTE